MYIPSAVSPREKEALQRYSRDRIVVEAGSLLGASTVAIAQTAREVTAIDRHTGYDLVPNDTFRLFLRNVTVAGVAGRVRPLPCDIRTLVRFPRSDFTFIDLCGTLETTAAAIRKARSPIVAIHDFQRQNCPGVEAAIKATGLRVIERVDSMIICASSMIG